MVALERDDACAAQRLLCGARQHARVGYVTDGVVRALKAKAHGVHHVVRGGEGLHLHAGDLKGVAGVYLAKGHAGQVLALLGGAAAGIQLALPAVAPYGDAAHVVSVLVGQDQRPHVLLGQAQLVHALERRFARQAVVDHDEAFWPLDQRAVAL